MKYLSLLAVTFLVWALFWSCGRSDSSEGHSPFHPRISAFTSGDISNQSSVMVEFTDSVPGAMPGMQAPNSWLSFEPSIEGEAAWMNDRTLVFKPASALSPGTGYKAQVALDNIFPDEKGTFFFSFHTYPQNIRFKLESLRPIVAQASDQYQLTLDVLLADYAPDNKVEEAVELSLNGKPLEAEWSHAGGMDHRLVVNELPRGTEEGKLVVKTRRGRLSLAEPAEYRLEIPARNTFKVIRARLETEPRERIDVIFSDMLDAGQELDGLFSFGADQNLVFSVQDNVVQIFPGGELTGEQQLNVLPGIRSASGQTLKGRGEFTFSFSSLKPAVEILGRGSIMPWSEGLFLPFKAVSLKSVKVRVIKIFEPNVGHFLQINDLGGEEQLKRAGRLVHHQTIDLRRDRTLNLRQWNTFSLELSAFIQPDPGALYRVELGFGQEDAIYPCLNDTVNESDGGRPAESPADNPDDNFWDNPDDYYSAWPYRYDPDYNWRERDNPCSSSYYTRERWVYRNVLASNLGLIAKQGEEGRLLVLVTDLRNTRPIENVEVEVLNFQMISIGTGNTDPDGKVEINTKGEPFLLTALLDKQRGYLRVDKNRALGIDRFDVAGQSVQKGIKGFIFGERGVWRPGDSLYISFMPMLNRENPLPANHPVTFELLDPRGRLVKRMVETHPRNAIYSFPVKTNEDAPTGTWKARVLMGGALFEKNLRIETVRPNRLKINLKWQGDSLLRAGQNIDFSLASTWLHGAPASGLKSDVRLNLRSSSTRFPGFGNYTFNDLTRDFEFSEQTLFEGDLNSAGKTRLNARLPEVNNAPGMLKGRLTTRVFELAGTFSIDHQPVTVSPYSSYLGISVPSGDDRGMLQTDTNHRIDVVAVDPYGKLTNAVKSVSYTIYKIDWRWWWEKNEEDLGRFISSGSRHIVASGSVKFTGGKGSLRFKVDKPEWGRYLVRLENPVSGHAVSQTIMIDWPGWADDSQEVDGASVLVFQAEKEAYKVGDKVKITFPSSKDARALVSLENGTRVLKSWWVDSREGETAFNFEATPEMTPNIYVSITLLQPHGQTTNNRPIRLFGIIPVNVEDPETHLSPQITTPNTWRPEQEAVVEVSEKEGRAMDYVLAVVDQGLLDLTRFQTPAPWHYFNAREALGVSTWDIYDQVLGAFGGKIEQLFSIGGDQGLLLNREGANRMRRFEPMVHFSGPHHLEKGKENKHRLMVPSYTGAVRVMVVGTQGAANGHAQQDVEVKQPLMVWSALPRLMGPGEKLKLPVTVFAMDKRIGRTEVSLKTSAHFKVQGVSSRTVTFDGAGEENLFFELETLESTGKAMIEILARSGSEEAKQVTFIEIRIPNPPVTQSVSAVLQGGETEEMSYTLPGLKGTNSATLEVSAVPPMNLTRRLNFLLDYPHGCIEQRVSKAFPQLFLGDVLKLSAGDSLRATRNISEVLQALSQFQTGDGGFAYWPGQSQVSDWSTSYTGHFMLEADKKGYLIPPGLLKGWLNYQKRKASLWLPRPATNAYTYEQVQQAYRLFTLALAGEPDQSSMNRLRQQDRLMAQTRWLLATAYSLSGLDEVAQTLMMPSEASREIKVVPYTFGSTLRDKSLLAGALLQMGQRKDAMPLVRDIAEDLNLDNWYSTQTTAFALMTVARFTQGDRPEGRLEFQYTVNNQPGITVGTDKSIFQADIDLQGNYEGRIALENFSGGELFATLFLKGIPAGIDSTVMSRNLVLRSRFLSMDNKPLDISSLTQGTDLKYVVEVYNPGTAGDATNLALTQMVPSGWEIRNTRLEGEGAAPGDEPDYRDYRDDRVFSYFDLSAGATRRFVVICNAAFAGQFYLPPASCEAMYNNEIRARTNGRMIGSLPPTLRQLPEGGDGS